MTRILLSKPRTGYISGCISRNAIVNYLSRRIEQCTKDLEGTRESLRLVGDAQNPMFQDMYDGQTTAGMVAREQSEGQLDCNSSFQQKIKSVSFVSPPDTRRRTLHRGLCVVHPPDDGHAQASSILENTHARGHF